MLFWVKYSKYSSLHDTEFEKEQPYSKQRPGKIMANGGSVEK